MLHTQSCSSTLIIQDLWSAVQRFGDLASLSRTTMKMLWILMDWGWYYCKNVKNVSSSRDRLMTAYVSTCRPRGQDLGFPTAFTEFRTQYSPIVTPRVGTITHVPSALWPFWHSSLYVSDYLKHLPPASADYKDTQGKGADCSWIYIRKVHIEFNKLHSIGHVRSKTFIVSTQPPSS